MSREAFEAAINVLTGQTKAKQPKRLCGLCEGEKAVGKYYVHPDESENHGWWRVCSYCAAMVSNVGANVEYYKYSQEYKNGNTLEQDILPERVQACNHEFEKWSNVGEFDKYKEQVFDWMRCKHCQVYGKRFGLGQHGITDLMMEIDLSCSR